ncbi:hypothetical protein CEW89_10850 [Celeribacter ethanolicus]|jgi:hypothetical protein|uniref:Uncharacterized protein n=1 Tax=Celeribacter ethanolicus TaxID=1758178 RepID=A0A291GD96_9RHOB|nr:hypothetical protein [Celeribacter ethanolicus]ATG48014.1 hypothetical protein CEW89_10850 [Celeribacter ethanolicus]
MASETITACENICRDFSWLGSISDWMPLFTSIVIAFGGFSLYRFQKQVDRSERLHEEKRKVYVDFLAVHLEYVVERQITEGDHTERKVFTELISLATLLGMYAPDEITAMAHKLVRETTSATDAQDQESKPNLRSALIKEMKADLLK